MDFSQEIVLAPLFDFLEFYDNQTLTDCIVYIGEDKESSEAIHAHILVLANSSGFFYNVFTGDMEEAKTHEVHVQFNPKNLLPKIIRWMYNGKLTFETEEEEKNEIIPILAISNFYNIEKLKKHCQNRIEEYFSGDKNPSLIFDFIDQCFEYELSHELKFLEGYMATNFEKLDINKISDSIDVQTFINIIKKRAKMTNREKIDSITKFIKDYDFTGKENEMNDLCLLLDRSDKQLKEILNHEKPKWCSIQFLNSLSK